MCMYAFLGYSIFWGDTLYFRAGLSKHDPIIDHSLCLVGISLKSLSLSHYVNLRIICLGSLLPDLHVDWILSSSCLSNAVNMHYAAFPCSPC